MAREHFSRKNRRMTLNMPSGANFGPKITLSLLKVNDFQISLQQTYMPNFMSTSEAEFLSYHPDKHTLLQKKNIFFGHVSSLNGQNVMKPYSKTFPGLLHTHVKFEKNPPSGYLAPIKMQELAEQWPFQHAFSPVYKQVSLAGHLRIHCNEPLLFRYNV